MQGHRLCFLLDAQVAAAQLCYAVAGTPLQAWDPASRLCLLGGDHRRLPGSARSVAAFQRTEIYDWAMTAGELRFLRTCAVLHGSE